MRVFLKVDFGCQCKIIAYADDLVLLVFGGFRVDIERRTQMAIDKIVRWRRYAKLEFSRPKTLAMMLKGTLDQYRKPIVMFQDERVRLVEHVKYQGVIIDEYMIFSHVFDVVERARKLLLSLNAWLE